MARSRVPFAWSFISRPECEPLNAEDEAAIIAQMVQGDKSAKDRLVMSCARMAFNLASGWRHRAMPDEDRFQTAMMGLTVAANTFRPGRGNRFSSFAFFVMRHRLVKASLGDYGPLISVGAEYLKQAVKWQRWETLLFCSLGRTPTEQEVAEASKMPAGKGLLNALQAIRPSVSIHAAVTSNDRKSLMVLDNVSSSNSADTAVVDARDSVARLRKRMTTKEFNALEMRYGQDKKLREIADVYGLCKQRIGQIVDKATSKARLLLLHD